MLSFTVIEVMNSSSEYTGYRIFKGEDLDDQYNSETPGKYFTEGF
jgi:hypothetical protein